MYSSLIQFFVFFALIGLIILYTDQLPFLYRFCSVLRIITFFVVFPQVLCRISKLKLFHYFFFLYFILLLCSCVFHGMGLYALVFHAVTIFALIGLLTIGFERDVNQTLRILTLVFSLFVIANFFLILLSPDGMWKLRSDALGEIVGYYFVGGNRNQMGATLLVAYLTSSLYSQKTGKLRKLNIIVLVSSIISLIIIDSKTSILGFLATVLFMYVKKEKIRKYSLFAIIVGYFLFQFIVVFTLTDISSNQYVSYLVEDVLGKDLTFSGRVPIWERSLLMFYLSPIWGYGLYDTDFMMFYINAFHPHNFIYSILIKGGVCLLSCAVCLCYISIRQTYIYKSNISIMLLFGFWIFLFMSIMEVYPFILFAYILTLLFYSKYYLNSFVKNVEHTSR